jgi:hypothetical protein
MVISLYINSEALLVLVCDYENGQKISRFHYIRFVTTCEIFSSCVFLQSAVDRHFEYK